MKKGIYVSVLRNNNYSVKNNIITHENDRVFIFGDSIKGCTENTSGTPELEILEKTFYGDGSVYKIAISTQKIPEGYTSGPMFGGNYICVGHHLGIPEETIKVHDRYE